MMDVQNLQARVDQVESKRAQLLKFQADPNLSSLALDIDQALIEMDDLMAEFRQTFPTGIVEPLADN
jgi:lipopolysaccharide biosynthesis protein